MPRMRKQQKEEVIPQTFEDFADANQAKVLRKKAMVVNVNKSHSKGKASVMTEEVQQITGTKRKVASKESNGVAKLVKRRVDYFRRSITVATDSRSCIQI